MDKCEEQRRVRKQTEVLRYQKRDRLKMKNEIAEVMVKKKMKRVRENWNCKYLAGVSASSAF